MELELLKNRFEEVNLLNEKESMKRLKFCWELIKSDETECIKTHLEFINKSNNYLKKDLLSQFQFRKDKLKVYQFLCKKLEEKDPILSQEMFAEIINIMDFHTLEKYQNWLLDLKKGKREDKLDFVWSIMKSPYIEYHYELMKDKTLDSDFREHLQNRFDEHKEAAEKLLLSKLEHNEDVDFQGEIIFILGQVAFTQKEKILNFARELTHNENAYVRNKAIIVLSWLGNVKDYKILENHLLQDDNQECRGNSAIAFFWINERTKSKTFKPKVYQLFMEVLKYEEDYFVIAMIIYSMREMAKNKFGISEKAIDELYKERIDLSKNRVIRYITKELKIHKINHK